MAPFSPIPSRHPIRVVLSSTALLPFMSVRRAAALAIAQLGVAAFFISGVTRTTLGDSAAWFVLAATVLSFLLGGLLLAAAPPAAAQEDTLAKIKRTGAMTIGFRESSPPFSFLAGNDPKPQGYSIDLCLRIVDGIKKELALPQLDVKWVKVTPETRARLPDVPWQTELITPRGTGGSVSAPAFMSPHMSLSMFETPPDVVPLAGATRL